MSADRLSSHERLQLGNLALALDHERVRLYRATSNGLAGLVRSAVLWASQNRAVALGNHVFLPERCQHDLPVLAHELTHCLQYQAWGPWRYFTRGIAAQAREWLHRKASIGTSPYRYEPDPSKRFEDYGMEQQCQIVEDCFRGHPAARHIAPFHPGGKS
jgi:Domain of unknown function (DUF4157)